MIGPTAAALAAAMAWAAMITGLPPAPTPQVVITAVGPDNARLGHRAGGLSHSAGLALPGIIYLPPDWVAGDPADECVLIHEAVHVLQFASAQRYRCTAEMEPLAWLVESYCLEMRGVDFWRLKGTAAIAVAQAALCN